MGRYKKSIEFGVLLVLLSAFFYFLHFLMFRDLHHILIYMMGDIAFVFIEVLMVTLIIHRLLEQRAKRTMLKKLNMVIGAFYSEVGTKLLEYFNRFDARPGVIAEKLVVKDGWSDDDFAKVTKAINDHEYDVDIEKGDLTGLQEFIVGKRGFFLRLLENPNLLEHETFTELLWAVFHLMEELSHREAVGKLGKADMVHLAGDIKRAYGLVVREWLVYMQHLKSDYPYLFSLAMRTNPFDPEARVEVV